MRLTANVGAAAVLFVAGMANAAAQLTPTDTLSATGIGAVKFGMTLAQASEAGVTLVTTGLNSGPGCYFAHPVALPGLSFMLRDGKIVRADIAAPSEMKTVDGFKRGDKEGAITGFYAATQGGVSDFPMSTDSDISVLAAPEFSKGDQVPRIVYEVTDAAGVTTIHAGWVPRHFSGCPST